MTLFRNLTRVSRLGAMMLVPVGLMVGCTDLKETPTSLITKDTFYKNSDEVIAGLAAVYANLRSQYDQLYSLNQVSSEETVAGQVMACAGSLMCSRKTTARTTIGMNTTAM